MQSLGQILLKQSTQIPTIDIKIKDRGDIDYICHCTGFSLDELKQSRRNQELVAARYVIFNYFRKRGYSLQNIGDIFGKDHSTVIAGLKRMQKLIEAKDAIMIDAMRNFRFNLNNLLLQSVEIFMQNDFNIEDDAKKNN